MCLISGTTAFLSLDQVPCGMESADVHLHCLIREFASKRMLSQVVTRHWQNEWAFITFHCMSVPSLHNLLVLLPLPHLLWSGDVRFC